MSNPTPFEQQFAADAAAVEQEWQTFQAEVTKMMPDLAHVLFVAPICAVHEIPADQCGCP